MEREAREHVARVEQRLERRLDDLSQTWIETYLLHLAIFGVMIIIVGAVSHH